VTLGISMFAWLPPLADRFGLPAPDFVMRRGLKLGLDLHGGVQMVLRVNTDDALLAETRDAARRIEEGLRGAGMPLPPPRIVGPGVLQIDGVDPGAGVDVVRTAEEIAPALVATGADAGSYVFRMPDAAVAERRRETVAQARQVVERRVDELGVTEPFVAVQGARGDELVVQLPGVDNVERAIDVLGATALLEWRMVEQGPAVDRNALLATAGGRMPTGAEVLASREAGTTLYYLVEGTPVVTGRDLRSARSAPDEFGRPGVAFSLTRDATERFAALTRDNVGRRLAIVLDGRVHSAPFIEGPIERGVGSIRGGFTAQEAADLALVLRAGALPASLSYEGGYFVGPSLGSASIRAGIAASMAGLLLTTSFMLAYYRRAGVNAVVSIAANLLLLVGLLAYPPAALTLPGFAGLLLTIGMGLDSNILIFERIREELAAGRSPRAAVAAGFDRVFLTILDTHVASLIAAAFLFQFGSGPVRGFATTLTFGLLTNVFTSVFVSRTLFEWSLARGRQLRMGAWALPVPRRPLRVYRWRWHAAAASAVVIALGIGAIGLSGVPLGVDFTGGTVVRARFAAPVAEDAVRDAVPGDEIVQRYDDPDGHGIMIRAAHGDGAPGALAARVAEVSKALDAADLPAFAISGSEVVGPAAGAELRRKGLYASAASLAGITAYVALRFRPSFAVGAIAATGHDLLVTASMLSLFGHELSLNVVAALLATAGYSVNDTIVIFDRVRENLRLMPRAPLDLVVGTAVSQTLGRTFLTAGTTFLAVLALCLFGGEPLRGFSFAMLVGVVTGTYSTIFIATALAVGLSARRRR
jgi:protein-export membrane protein SecD/preprotein translocase SecF subunit